MQKETTKHYIGRLVRVQMYDQGYNITTLAAKAGVGRNTMYAIIKSESYNAGNLFKVLDTLSIDLKLAVK